MPDDIDGTLRDALRTLRQKRLDETRLTAVRSLGAGADAMRGSSVGDAVRKNDFLPKPYETQDPARLKLLEAALQEIYNPDDEVRLQEAKTKGEMMKYKFDLLGKLIEYEKQLTSSSASVSGKKIDAYMTGLTTQVKALQDLAENRDKILEGKRPGITEAISKAATSFAKLDRVEITPEIQDLLDSSEPKDGTAYALAAAIAARQEGATPNSVIEEIANSGYDTGGYGQLLIDRYTEDMKPGNDGERLQQLDSAHNLQHEQIDAFVKEAEKKGIVVDPTIQKATDLVLESTVRDFYTPIADEDKEAIKAVREDGGEMLLGLSPEERESARITSAEQAAERMIEMYDKATKHDPTADAFVQRLYETDGFAKAMEKAGFKPEEKDTALEFFMKEMRRADRASKGAAQAQGRTRSIDARQAIMGRKREQLEESDKWGRIKGLDKKSMRLDETIGRLEGKRDDKRFAADQHVQAGALDTAITVDDGQRGPDEKVVDTTPIAAGTPASTGSAQELTKQQRAAKALEQFAGGVARNIAEPAIAGKYTGSSNEEPMTREEESLKEEAEKARRRFLLRQLGGTGA